MSDIKDLSQLLNRSGLMAKKQDGKYILYNRAQKFLSRGILVESIEDAIRAVQQYIRFVQTSGFVSLPEFAAEHMYRPVPFKEVNNLVDEASAYYIRKAAMSTVSRMNLLLAAKEIQSRVEASYLSRTVASRITDSDVRRYLKLKQAAASHLEDAEKAD